MSTHHSRDKRYGEARNASLLNIAHFSRKLEKHGRVPHNGYGMKRVEMGGGNLPLPLPQGWIGHKSV